MISRHFLSTPNFVCSNFDFKKSLLKAVEEALIHIYSFLKKKRNSFSFYRNFSFKSKFMFRPVQAKQFAVGERKLSDWQNKVNKGTDAREIAIDN